MKKAYIFNEVAVLFNHWYEVDDNDEEHGVRLEVRTLAPQEQRGSIFAPQMTVIDGCIMRADLFDIFGQTPGNMKRAHYHMNWDGLEPVDRDWSDFLSSDPFAWLEEQLSDLEGLVAARGVELHDAAGEAEELRRQLPAIIAEVKALAGEHCSTARDCFDQTRHGHAMVIEQMKYRRPDGVIADPRLAEV